MEIITVLLILWIVNIVLYSGLVIASHWLTNINPKLIVGLLELLKYITSGLLGYLVGTGAITGGVG